MFIGNYRHTLDDKGRFIMPSKLRKSAGTNEFFLTFNEEDGSLYLFTKHRWDELEKKLEAERSFDGNEDDRDFIRTRYYNAAECTLSEKQGRLSIPQHLIDLAQIKKDILIVGLPDRIEIWAIKVWENYDKQRRLRLEARKKCKMAETGE
ncbi:MAG: division/cell wall cluster transcriptional repressor MraZ [bacterium]